MEDVKIRLLKAGEIECRVGTISENGLSLLLYKDARADQRILDEAFGCFGWKRSHQSIDGRLYCTVEVWDGKKKEWIGKQDVGTAGSAEKGRLRTALKGPASVWESAGNSIRPPLSGCLQGSAGYKRTGKNMPPRTGFR